MPFIDPNLITIPLDRAREDFSGVDEIAQSIKEIGQIHPILVKELPPTDEKFINLELLAGETRVRACQKLGREVWYQTTKSGKIEAETELQKTRIEAMENLGRKELSPHEKNKLIDKIDFLMKEEYGQSIGKRHQSEEDKEKWNTEKTAKMLGFKSKATVSAASQMVRVAEAVPEIKEARTASEQRAILAAAVREEARQELIRRARERLHSAPVSETSLGRMSSNGQPIVQKSINYDQWASSKLWQGKSQELLKKLPPSSVDIWLSDPPFAIHFDPSRAGDKSMTLTKELTGTNYDDDPQDMMQVLMDCVPLIAKASKPRSYVFWFCAFRYWHVFSDLFTANGFNVMPKPIIWVQASLQEGKLYTGAGSQLDKWPTSNSQCCLFAHRDGFLAKQGRPDVLIIPPVNPNEKEHSVEKPVELMTALLEFVCVDIVKHFIVDPFCGSGTSLVAALKINPDNDILGFDLNPKCIEIAKGRIIAERMIKK